MTKETCGKYVRETDSGLEIGCDRVKGHGGRCASPVGYLDRIETLETALRLALLWIPLPEMIERAEPKAQVQAIWDAARELGLVEEGG